MLYDIRLVVKKVFQTFKDYTARMTPETITVCLLEYLIQHMGFVPMGSLPYRSGIVQVPLWALELCRLEYCTPGGATYAEQVEE